MKLCVYILIIASSLLAGCSYKSVRELYPEIAIRKPPAVSLESELVLIDTPATIATSLVTKDDKIHVFIADENKQLHHLELFNNIIEKHELLGKVDRISPNVPIDAIEHPVGKLHVLIGDRQFVRSTPNGPWREIAENRCIRFLTVADRLFCGFTTSGKEINSPKRRDWTVGLFFILPVVY